MLDNAVSRPAAVSRRCEKSVRRVRSFVSPPVPSMPLVPGRGLAPLVVGLVGSSAALLYYLRARHRQTSRRALDLLRVVDSGVLEAELDRRRVGSHVFNTTVRPLHALRSQLLDAALLTLGIDVAADELTPGPPRKAYDSFARPRDGKAYDLPTSLLSAPHQPTD